MAGLIIIDLCDVCFIANAVLRVVDLIIGIFLYIDQFYINCAKILLKMPEYVAWVPFPVKLKCAPSILVDQSFIEKLVKGIAGLLAKLSIIFRRAIHTYYCCQFKNLDFVKWT